MQKYTRTDKHPDEHSDTQRVTFGDTDTLTTTSSGQLAHLDDLDDWRIADGDPDIRGWDVRTTDHVKVGEVEDLLVDTGARTVRYIEVRLEKDVSHDIDRAVATGHAPDDLGAAIAKRIEAATDDELDPRETRFVLVPIGAARLDDAEHDVLLDVHATHLAGIPDYERVTVTPDYERDVLRSYGASSAAIDGIAPPPP